MTNDYIYDTPIGKIRITEDGTSITEIDFIKEDTSKISDLQETNLLKEAYRQLMDYFAGKITDFDLPLNPKGTTFQKKVWSALQEIPYGETRSYKEIAIAVSNPKACRAVGMANNRNPLPIVIPCHRVIGANGNLVGYGGGLDIKVTLLDLEKIRKMPD